MIKANRQRWFEWIMRKNTLPQIRKQFHSVYWQGSETYPSPAIYIANHTSWWDGLLYFHLRHTVIDKVIYIMMHEKGLQTYWYFKWIGAYSVNKSSRRDVVEALAYSKQLLQQKKSIWIFPQGDEFHQEKRPLQLEAGVGHLASQVPNVPIIPLTIYYWFGHQKKAAVAIRGGQPIYFNDLPGESKKEKMMALEKCLETQLDALKHDVTCENMDGYQRI